MLLYLHCGCKVNQYETNAIKQKFLQSGYHIKDFSEKADIYVINTCTVTNMSDRKSRQMLRRVKEKNKNAVLVVTGCYAQVAQSELEKIDDIDIVLGNTKKGDIVKYVEDYISKKIKITKVEDIMQEKNILEFGQVSYTEKTRAVIKIQDGCDRFCSYCIIPYARGRVRSREIKNIVSEIEEITKNGIKEVVITGIHIASYGKDLTPKTNLISLLEEINKIKNVKRIRLGSLEPTIIDEEFIKRLVKLEKICDHFHLSLQSGCNETLKRMNRRYTVEQFEQSVKLIRKNYPNVALTTDIIVGFPGETEEEFKQTYNYLDKIDFYKMHIFKYSARKGTKAAVMQNQVTSNIKEERSEKLIKLSNKKQLEHNKKYIQKELDVLIEERVGDYLKGHTSNYIVVHIKTDKKDLENTIQKVKIQSTINEDLLGIIV